MTTDDAGSIPLPTNNYIALSASTENQILVPYRRTYNANWCIRIAGGNPYIGSCLVAFVSRS